MDDHHPHREREVVQELISISAFMDEFERECIERPLPLALFDHKIADLSYRLNATTHIARLPSETLALVFEAYTTAFWRRYTSHEPSIDADIVYISRIRPRQESRPGDWYAILHVCRHWRNVALSTHRLWTRIIPGSKSIVEQAISRSGCIPLFIGLADPTLKDLVTRGHNDHLNVEPYTSIFPELHRIRTLRLPMTRKMEETMSKVLAIRPIDAPLLEELEVRFFQGVESLPHFPMLALSNLRKLCLSMAPLSIVRAIVRPTLTHLRLSGKFCELGLLPYLEVLGNLPNLEDLFLSWARNVREDYDFVAPQLVFLPRLQILTLEDPGTGWNGLKILESCIFPATTFVSFIGQRMIHHPGLLFPPLAHKLLVPDRKDAPPFLPQSMRISDNGYCFEIWSSVVSFGGDFDLVDAQYLVHINSHCRKGHLPSTQFLTSLNLSNSLVNLCVRTCELHAPDSPGSDWWVTTFGGMVRLESLRLEVYYSDVVSEFLKAFCTALAPTITSDDDLDATGQAPSYLFPHLRVLDILMESLIDDDDNDDRDNDDDDDDYGLFERRDFALETIQYLGLRQREGPRLPLLKIFYRRGYLSEEEVNLLRQAEIADRRKVIVLPSLNSYVAKPTW
ncbi:hypothetical protein EIP86_010750 [Pleurotus ostreatoroseus]|nr:hypothetical protein EIP86_010750 [Pleurotus ostreatoroseus]